ncbi:unnamed protein product [Peniophora sp. CBMAI 1063]|nr:unnamed protein product [Peniophora sp. CBMAI 1063]
MSYVIFGKAIKNEYLALGTLLSTVGLAVSMTGGKKDAAAPKAAAPATVGSSSSKEEDEFIANFIKEAEKESGAGH